MVAGGGENLVVKRVVTVRKNAESGGEVLIEARDVGSARDVGLDGVDRMPGGDSGVGGDAGLDGARGLLAGMRIRKKLIVLHTVFSLGLAAILMLALRPAAARVVGEAEAHEAGLLLGLLSRAFVDDGSGEAAGALDVLALRARVEAERERLGFLQGERGFGVAGSGVAGLVDAGFGDVVVGSADALGLSSEVAESARRVPGTVVATGRHDGPADAVVFHPTSGAFVGVDVRLSSARAAVVRLYVLVVIALLAVYGLVAASLELFVLPRHVYRPIRALLAADAAVQAGRERDELVPAGEIPADELGEIMRSRNETVSALRRHQSELARTMARLEAVLNDLQRKNHLLEAARRNLADADRLASLGMMSAGIAHELNTPLSVIKGLVEKLNESGAASLTEGEGRLMLRVVHRLEGLSESLLDFARARPAEAEPAALRGLIDEAWTLVAIDRGAQGVRFFNRVGGDVIVPCEPDRIVQVLVNLLRNGVDALDDREGQGEIVVESQPRERDGRRWVSVTISDSGPGIAPEVIEHLFEPFVSTRLDASGTGLGLAVANGIVGEHGGVLLARNRVDGRGAVFEMVLPMDPGGDEVGAEGDGAGVEGRSGIGDAGGEVVGG